MLNKVNLVNTEQAAKYLAISKRTLSNWRSIGFPLIPYLKIGRCIRYRLSDLDEYLNQNRISHTSMGSMS